MIYIDPDLLEDVVSAALQHGNDDPLIAAAYLSVALSEVETMPDDGGGVIEIAVAKAEATGRTGWAVRMRAPAGWQGPRRPKLFHTNLGAARCDAANWSVRTGFPVREVTADVLPFPNRAGPRAVPTNDGPEAA